MSGLLLGSVTALKSRRVRSESRPFDRAVLVVFLAVVKMTMAVGTAELALSQDAAAVVRSRRRGERPRGDTSSCHRFLPTC